MDRRTFLKSSGAAAAAATTAGAAAQASESLTPGKLAKPPRYRMRVQWPLDVPGLGTTAAQFIAHLSTATDGRLQIAIVPEPISDGPPNTPLDGEFAIRFADDEIGLVPAMAALSGQLEWHQLDTWLRSAGGQLLWDEHAADRGIKPFLIGHTTTNGGIWLREPLANAHNLDGYEIAAHGLIAEVLSELGSHTPALSLSDTVAGLRSGNISGAVSISAYSDTALGLSHVVGHHYILPSFDNGRPIILTIPLPVWQRLSAGDQSLVEAIAARVAGDCVAEHSAHDALVRQAMQFQTQGYGAELPMPLLQRSQLAARRVVDRLADQDAEMRRVHDSVQGFLRATRDRHPGRDTPMA